MLRRLCELAPPSLDRSIRSQLTEHIESVCRAVYGESNRRTAELTGLKLAALGYQWR